MGARAHLIVLVALAAGAGDARAEGRRRRPAAGALLEAAALAWPAGTISVEARGRVEIYRRPGHDEIGALAGGSRVAWTRIVASRDRCRAWLAIEPRGWVCAADVVPSALAPAAAIDPDRVVARALARIHAGVVPRGADAYATRVAIQAGTPTKRVPGWSFLRADTEVVRIDARRYYRTRHGYIPATATEPRRASTFAGVDLRPGPVPWPLAWVTPHRRGDAVIVRAAADQRAAQVATLARRDLVAVLEERAGFARIGRARWVALAELRVARTSPRPGGVRADERWVDIDLDEQVLVAYEGDRPVYATLISSGIGRSTPTALHRIEDKRLVARLKSPEVALGRWDMPDVPFAMTFREHYALHGVYWHDSFGKRRSAGCINLAPRDARFLFGWTLPALPAGWLQGEVDDGSGTPIRLRNRHDPDPAWTPFDAPPPVPTRATTPAADE